MRAGEDDENRAVLVVASEIATLHSAETESDLSSVIAMSLFSDGAGAFVVTTKGEWEFSNAGMSLIPDSQHLLGMVPHSPPSADKPPRQCYAMGLHPDVPVALSQYFAVSFTTSLAHPMLQQTTPWLLYMLCRSRVGKPALALCMPCCSQCSTAHALRWHHFWFIFANILSSQAGSNTRITFFCHNADWRRQPTSPQADL